MSDANLSVPSGFEPVPMGGSFMAANGPLWVRKQQGGVKVGFRVEQRHCNVMGGLHGGMLATFIDMMLLVATHHDNPPLARHLLPTISLQVDFIGPAMLHDWVEGEGQVLKATRSMVFAQGLVRSQGLVIARCSGVYKIAGEIGDSPGMYTDSSPLTRPQVLDTGTSNSR